MITRYASSRIVAALSGCMRQYMSPHIAVALVAVVTSDACSQQQTQNAYQKPLAAPIGVAVYALSRGKSVPEGAKRVFAQAGGLFQELLAAKQVVRVYPVERIGIEGERRLCADFVDQQAARAAHARLLKLAEGVELLNVVIEPCVKN